ncbi:DNA topoisomerase II [Wickerhamomyces ciferrii]|uniref:DNA topoisomerase 2 n=1 Tax=Wickerhamomyces ciferrii (strain ATCC 14091 / BCRC 22168 / CBS 111 / JCM 3599 / NBRC 0793 / NRRL Y-1031 F-60-10) TaxID=1206466 RepID=K0KT01_WICCF|nr:DNA topoisomerase II [Wickerhamomyces ciferrii]CCH45177.1 DNA topoisomerase II [Wickerhamomyces ciferrii]
MVDPLGDAQSKVNKMTPKKKNVSEQYQKLSQLEHILKRPDTYIGSTEHQESNLWIYDDQTESMMEKPVKLVPGLFKIFDEILVNAADNKIRDPSMKKIEVTINPEENLIEIKNDGRGIPIEMHEKEGIYIPELIFGNLLTSSNYDDDEKKVVGGRNGYGAKLCNIFSTEFTVETADKNTMKIYTQTWNNNMTKTNKPKIKTVKKPQEYTKISFKPDLAKFNMEILDNDTLGVLRRRVYDIAGTLRDVNVSLNGTTLKIRSFKQYVEMYIKALEAKKALENGEPSSEDSKKPTIVYKKIEDPKSKGRWEIAFGVSDSAFNQVSFVNSIATTSGGTHVNYIADQIVDKIGDVLKKRHKNSTVKPFQIRNNMFLFVNCLIENPAFTSQTKEQMSTRRQQFGSEIKVPDDFINQVLKTEFISNILDAAQANADKALRKTDGSKKSRITNYSKLEDANKAGTREGYKCTLILTEGDSALSLAVAGLAVVGRDYFGCFPLRGKMLNVRDASNDQITKNAEIQAIKQIMGLQHKKKYEDLKSLRYGRIMIMTDQDTDGSHIKGLIINFLETSFPGLLNIPGFLLEFITPIVKVNITKPRRETLAFYNMPEYESWIENESHQYTWTHKYYKGLGTSSQEEGREYFSDLEKHLKTFNPLEENDKGLIDLAFSKKKADHRKEWLRGFVPGTHLDIDLNEIPISEFINKELILFSMADNIRSIPSVLDGFKPGQRKILYGSFKRNLKSEIKVAQLAGYISEHTGYHHGEQSLITTIVGLAQDFVGSNNINLLLPKGSFGTRNMGGKDASAARYIYTELATITRKIFNQTDDALYTYEQDDGENVEPTWYLPIIPMVLVNGAEGIGTGWSTNVPQFNPADLVENMKRLMNNQELLEMEPWYKGWDGQIQKIGPDKYKVYGKIEKLDDNTLAITELPVKTWTASVKEQLLLGLGGSDKVKPWIKDMQEQHGLGIRFIVTLSDAEMKKSEEIGLYERFKLHSVINLSNMVLFDPQGRIKKYETVDEILKDFYYVRLDYYQRRKDNLAKELSNHLEKLSSQARFIKLIIDKKLNINNRKRVDLIENLQELNFPKFDKKGNPIFIKKDPEDITQDQIVADEDAEDDGLDADASTVHIRENVFSSYDYLLGLPIWSLTRERYEKLLQQKANKEDELTELLKLTSKDLWNRDLDDFMISWKQFLKDDEYKRTTLVVAKKGGKGKKRSKNILDDDDWSAGGPSKKKKKTNSNELKFDDRKGDLIPIPDYVAPKTKVKKETTPKVEEIKQEDGSSSTSSSASGSSSKSSSVAPKATTSTSSKVKKESGPKQTKLNFSTLSKPEVQEPEFKSVFGKGNTIFGSPIKKKTGTDVYDLDADELSNDMDGFIGKFGSASSAFDNKPSSSKQSSSSTTDEVIELESEEEEEVKPSKPAPKRRVLNKTTKPSTTTSKPAPKRKAKVVESESEEDEFSESDDDVVMKSDDEEVKAPSKRSTRGVKKSYKVVESDNEDSFVVDDESDEDFE